MLSIIGWLREHRKDLLKIGIVIGGSLVCALAYDQWRKPKQPVPSEIAPEVESEIRRLKQRSGVMFTNDDFIAPVSLLTKLKLDRGPLEHYIRNHLMSDTLELLDKYSPPAYPESRLLFSLTIGFNSLLRENESIYERARFANVKLSKETQALLDSHPESNRKLNRMLLEDAYPYEILGLNRKREISELAGSITATELLDAFKKHKGDSYLGKRYLIRGIIGEVVNHERPEFLSGMILARGVMLVSKDNLPVDEMRLPFDREHYGFVSIPESRDSQAAIQFEGVYCLFIRDIDAVVLDDDSEFRRKKELLVSCEIAGFEKGLTRRHQTEYGPGPRDSLDKYAGQEKDRVIATNCIEKTHAF